MGSSLERLYPCLPLWAQNIGISMYGLAWRWHRLGGRFAEYVAGFHERDRWSVNQMQDYVQKQLRHSLCSAFEHVPYYRRVWGEAGIVSEDLRRITLDTLHKMPLTPKQDLRAQPTRFINSKTAASERLYRYYSSGSTGTPVTAICTAEDHRRFIAAREVRSFGWAGSSIYRPRAMIGGRQVVPRGLAEPPFHRFNWAERQVYFSAYHISPSNTPAYVNAFNRYQPRLLTGYANSYFLLARMMIEQGLSVDYQPDAAVLCSEKLTPEMKNTIRKAFQTRAFEEYGAVENCALATECECGNLHFSPDFGILEIVDEKGKPLPPGVEGRIVCTSLLSSAQPLIRYEIGDIGILSASKCACGRDQLPVLQEIVGRLEDVVVGPDGRELVRFHWIYIDLPNVIEGQLVQEEIGDFVLKLVAKPGFGDKEETIIRQRFAERLGRVNVRFEKVSQIPRSERGKFRAVISKVSAREQIDNAEEWASR